MTNFDNTRLPLSLLCDDNIVSAQPKGCQVENAY